MPNLKLSIHNIQEQVSNRINGSLRADKKFSDLSDWPLIAGKQCIYIMDWQKGKLTFTRGLEAMLGYDEANGEAYEGVHDFHPDDALILNRIIRGIALHCVDTDISNHQEYLNVTYRLKKKNGSFVKVLRQSGAYELDQHGRLLSNWSYLTDISFMTNHNKVEWDIYANNLDVEAFRKVVYKEFINFFTKRETEIIRHMTLGLTNIQISEKLNISTHTVSTHRKNIFRKSQCSSAQELLEFCHKNGIL